MLVFDPACLDHDLCYKARNWPIDKPLQSNADEPIAVEYQLHGEELGHLRFQRHRETLEDVKLASVLVGNSICLSEGATVTKGSGVYQ